MFVFCSECICKRTIRNRLGSWCCFSHFFTPFPMLCVAMLCFAFLYYCKWFFSCIFERAQTMARTAPSHQISFLYSTYVYVFHIFVATVVRIDFFVYWSVFMFVCVWYICIYICGFADSSFVWFLCVWPLETRMYMMYGVQINIPYHTKNVDILHFMNVLQSNFIRIWAEKNVKSRTKKDTEMEKMVSQSKRYHHMNYIVVWYYRNGCYLSVVVCRQHFIEK